jgi:hypothetical protein
MSAGNRGDGISNCGHGLFLLGFEYCVKSYRFKGASSTCDIQLVTCNLKLS